MIPFWVSYLLRMLAWIGLLSSDGYVNKLLMDIGIAHPPDWLNGNAYSVILALVYGYIPYFILPVFAGLDRIDKSQIEAARDLGCTPFRAFLHVTLPLSRPSLLAGSALVVLPMFGDYYTNDLISGSPRTNMLGNEINLFVQGGPAEEPRGFAGRRADGDPVGRHDLLRDADRARRQEVRVSAPASAGGGTLAAGRRRLRWPGSRRQSWGRPRFLVFVTWAYVLWALVPVAVAILFSFDAGRTAALAGVLAALVDGRSTLPIFHDPDYVHALTTAWPSPAWTW